MLNRSRYADDTTLMPEGEEEQKRLVMKMKEESERASLKLNIENPKIVASGPITSWRIEREKLEVVSDFLFLDSEITVDGGCSHGIRRHLLLGRKAMTNLDSTLESRDIALPLLKAMVFPVGVVVRAGP